MDDEFRIALLLITTCLLAQCCWSLNDEGLALLRFRERVVSDPYGALLDWNRNYGEENPCSWFGVECSDGKVVILNLKDLCLGGTLASELGNLVHITSIVLRNNSFFGVIPEEVGELKELEMLDLGYNNFRGSIPAILTSSPSLTILLLDNNYFLDTLSSEMLELNKLSELQVDKDLLFNAAMSASCDRRPFAWNNVQDDNLLHVRMLQVVPKGQTRQKSLSSQSTASSRSASDSNGQTRQKSSSSQSTASSRSTSPSRSPPVSPSFISSPSLSPFSPSRSPSSSPLTSPAPSPAPTPDLTSAAPKNIPTVIALPPSHRTSPQLPPSDSPSQARGTVSHSKQGMQWRILSGAAGISFLLISVIGLCFCRGKKVVTVRPWATGLSGQLQKAFVTGVPNLKRSEVEAACEDFSNIIGSSSEGTVYKGTLSSGVEIAVASTAVTSAKDWSKQFEAEFRKKIDTLSKVNHKNFMNLLGYCEEVKPFTRMMVFEYAPNGTLFEHLHIKEAEHLDWGVRLRIAMGIAYCLEHMHQLNPPVIHKNLQSSNVYLTEDYAAKISDHSVWNEPAMAKMGSAGTESVDTLSPDLQTNIYNFGIILLEMVTGKLPFSAENNPIVEWASEYLRKGSPVRDMVDPTLKSFSEDELNKLCEVIMSCIHGDPKQRPTIREVVARLREIAAITPDGATPKISPLWWAELEIISEAAG